MPSGQLRLSDTRATPNLALREPLHTKVKKCGSNGMHALIMHQRLNIRASLNKSIMHSLAMDRVTLLNALLERRSLSPNGAARRMKAPKAQSIMSRLTKPEYEPKYSSMEPIARFFGVPVAAFFEESVAAEVAQNLGLVTGAAQPVGEPQASYGLATFQLPLPAHSLSAAIHKVASTLAQYDEPARKAVASLLSDLALKPEDAELTAARINGLLSAGEGNEEPPKSTIFARTGDGG